MEKGIAYLSAPQHRIRDICMFSIRENAESTGLPARVYGDGARHTPRSTLSQLRSRGLRGALAESHSISCHFGTRNSSRHLHSNWMVPVAEIVVLRCHVCSLLADVKNERPG